MVRTIKKTYGLDSPRVEEAMKRVPREQFVPEKYRETAYRDAPVPIGCDQTMSQPYTVAFMTHLLDLQGKEKVLEIGTGSGYQAAIMAELADKVYTMEIIPQLAESARETLKELGYENVYVKAESGEKGWPEAAPFDAMMITAGVEGEVPQALFDQLKKGGVLVAPVGGGYDKQMTRFTKGDNSKLDKEEFGVFHFVPFVEE